MTNAAPALHARFCLHRPGFSLDVDLTLPGRGVTAIFGHSGSGKTTLLRLIAGLERTSGSHLEINGELWQDDARRLFAPVHRRALGYVLQDAALFPHLTVAQNLAYGQKRRASTPPASDETCAAADTGALIELLGIGHLLERRPATLSGGERQRVAIARALLANPRLLLMDEPLAALDQSRKREILPYLERLHASLAIPLLYVTHSTDEVARLADHLVIMDAGRVVAHGPLAATLARLDLPDELADDMGTVIEGTVKAYDANYHLLTLAFPGGHLRVIHAPTPVGQRLRVQIKARDVSVTLSPATDTSILNVFPARVTAEQSLGESGHVRLGLDAGGTALTARLTRHSYDHLKLRPGLAVHVQIKAVSVLT
jgi:molybdate transport system ATP-binding protein